MNLQESIRRILKEEVTEDKNLYGEKLKVCSKNPMTGFYRDGYCRTGDDDTGSHTVCAKVTEEFLEFTKSMGNNLDMLEPGDKWCLCAKRWEEANKEGVAPEMIKSSTNIKTLDIIDSDEQELDEYARTLKNARRQGVGLRFPRSAVKTNPQRFRKYTRDNIKESDPKTGTGKKPEGSGRRLYTDENPNDTVSVRFRTKQDIIDTLNKDSFKSKPHKRQSQIINLIHQRVRAAYQNAKDPEVKQRLKKGYDYITSVKEKSKQKTIKLQKQKVNESDESRQERKFTKLLNNIEEYINSNSYNSVVRVMVDYDEVMDDVIVNIFFDAEKARELGGGINSVIKRSGKKIMEDLSVFPFDFKYHIHFEKPQLNESIKKILKEETEGIDSFLDEINSKHNMSDELKDFVKQFIEESDCKRINFSSFKMGVMGIALESGVLINKMALNGPLPFLLFLIFHEVAHQYQFKKYGEDIMYDCYLGEISEREAAEFMKHTEEVADDFASRKIRQLQKLNLIGPYTPPQMYKNVPIQQITMMINNYRNDMRRKNIDSPKKVSEYFYNMVKSEL